MRIVAWLRGGQSAISVYGEIMAAIYDETGADSIEDERAVRAGFDLLRDAGKLGSVLLQFPFSFHRTEDNSNYLENF